MKPVLLYFAKPRSYHGIMIKNFKWAFAGVKTSVTHLDLFIHLIFLTDFILKIPTF